MFEPANAVQRVDHQLFGLIEFALIGEQQSQIGACVDRRHRCAPPGPGKPIFGIQRETHFLLGFLISCDRTKDTALDGTCFDGVLEIAQFLCSFPRRPQVVERLVVFPQHIIAVAQPVMDHRAELAVGHLRGQGFGPL